MKYTLYILAEGTTIATQEIIAPEHDGYLLGVRLEELSRHGGEYAKALRGWAHALWSGTVDFFQAWVGYNDSIRIGLTNAWRRGSAECGIQPGDFTVEELETLRQIIESERSHIRPFLLWVAQNNKASGTKRRVVTRQTATWGLRYDDVFSRGKLLACSNLKYRWTLNVTRNVKTNCSSCLKLEGKIKRGSFWNRAGVRPASPKNNKLVCQGFLCGCALVQTDEPLSRGPLPKLP